MKTPHPKIKKESYPNGKPYWLVSCTLAGGERYRKKHETEQSANLDKVRLMRTATSGLSAREHVATEQAVHFLKTTENLDARGKDVLFAVEWFCQNFIDPVKIKTVRDYYRDFISIKRAQGRRPDTLIQLERFLTKFTTNFAKSDVTRLRYEDMEPWIKENSKGPEAERRNMHMAKHFFGYLSGQSKSTPNPYPILKQNPFQGHGVIHQNDDADEHSGIVIFEAAECRALIEEAQRWNAQRMFIWLLFTGMRPFEAVRFWTDERWGWNLISKDLKFIRVPKAISKTRKPRMIAVSDTLRQWLECYRDHPSFLTRSWDHKYTRVRSKVLPEGKIKPDIPRHTLISMMIKDGKGWAEIELQMGNKKDVQMRHYASLITCENEVQAFYGLTPDKFEHDMPEKELCKITFGRQVQRLAYGREAHNAKVAARCEQANEAKAKTSGLAA